MTTRIAPQNGKKRQFLSVLIIAPTFLLFSFNAALGATATARTGFWGSLTDTVTDSNTWRFETPTTKDEMTWSTGTNKADRTPFPRLGQIDDKFDFVGGKPVGKTINLKTRIDTGPLGSTAENYGTAVSGTSAGVWGTNYYIGWSVTATGTLGVPTKFQDPSYYSKTEGTDPFRFDSAKLLELGVADSSFDLYFHVGLEELNFSGRIGDDGDLSAARFNTSIGSTDGMFNLINLEFDAAGTSLVEVSSRARYFDLPQFDTDPDSSLFATEVSATDLTARILSDMSDNWLDDALNLAILVEDYLVPVDTMDDGTLFQVEVGIGVDEVDVGAVPLPASLPLLSAAFLLLGFFGKCRERLRKVLLHTRCRAGGASIS